MFSLHWCAGQAEEQHRPQAEQSHRWDPNGRSYNDFNNRGRCRRNLVTFRTPGAMLWVAIWEKELLIQFNVGCYDKGNFTF